MNKSSYDQKLVFLTVLFFFLCVVLFIVGLFRLDSFRSYMPFSQTRDYVIFEKNESWKLVSGECGSNDVCEQHTKVYSSGKVIGVGIRMFVDVFSREEMNSLTAAIVNTDILNKDCVPSDRTFIVDYTFKLGTQVKRVQYAGCKVEIEQIESQVFN